MKKFMPIFLLMLLSTISCGSDDSEKNTDQQSSQGQNFPVLFPDEDESEEESDNDDDSETILTSEPSDSCKDNSDDCDTTTWCVATSAYSGMTCYPARVKE